MPVTSCFIVQLYPCRLQPPAGRLLETLWLSRLMHSAKNIIRCFVQSNPGLQKLVAGVFGLPFGLAMVLICGAELFTGNTCSMAVALYEGNINLGDLIKNWVLSYAGARRASILNDVLRLIIPAAVMMESMT